MVMRMPRAASIASALVVGIWVFMAPASASATVTFAVSGGPSVISFPGPSPSTYTVTMVNDGATPETFSVETTVPSFGAGEQLEGATLRPSTIGALAGGATSQGGRVVPGEYSCSPVEVGVLHGNTDKTSILNNVLLAANSTGTLTQTFSIAPTPPWPGVSYVPTFTISNRLANGSVGTLTTGLGSLTPPQPRVDGRRGVHIQFDTKPATTAHAFEGTRATIRRGKRIRFKGTTEPVLKGRKIRLAFYYLEVPRSEVKLERIGVVRTNAKGRFRYPPKPTKKSRAQNDQTKGWAPRRLGAYEVRAYFDGGTPEIAPDFTCPRVFTLIK